MKKLLTIISFLLIAVPVVFAQSNNTQKSSTIVIVPGSWSSAADWESVTATLKAKGKEVIVVNLAGHGTDNTPIANISLQGYVDAVKKAIGNRTNVLLIGHSFGGIVISEVAEQMPAQIIELLFIAAYIPKNGESLLSIANTDANSDVPKYLKVAEKNGIASIDVNGITPTFVPDASQPVQAYVTAHFKAEPLAPLATPVTLTPAHFGSVNKVYVHTYNDKVNSYPLQQRMIKDAGITRFYGLPSSHTPFVSMPSVLAAIILNEAN